MRLSSSRCYRLGASFSSSWSGSAGTRVGRYASTRQLVMRVLVSRWSGGGESADAVSHTPSRERPHLLEDADVAHAEGKTE